VKLAQGSLSVHPRRLPEDEVLEVDTPNSAVSIDRPGVYRINVGEDGKSTVTVRHGEVELTAAGQAVPVRQAEEALVDGTDAPTYDVEEAGPEDSFDDWGLDRDRHEENLTSTRYVSSEVVGAEDLDAYGHWKEGGDYGPVWVPQTVAVGWAPYRNGHWAWVAPWGWTWVDDAPWGFAPFHYGRWAYAQGAWGWSPGTIVARPVYAPALVAFVGGGGWGASLSFGVGIGVGGGVGAVGWFPLGPHEVYVPPYPVSPAYVQQVNITHVTNINTNNFTVNNGVVTNVNIQKTTYVNQSAPGAITAVPQSAFVGSKSVASVAAVVPASSIRSATITSGAPAGIQAQPTSVLGHAPGTLTNVAKPPTAVLNRQFVAKVAPPAAPLAFSPTLKPVTTNLPPKPASQATNIPLLKPAVPLSGGLGLKPAKPNLVQPRVVSGTEIHGLPGAGNQPQGTGTHPVATGNQPQGVKGLGNHPVGAGNQPGVQGTGTHPAGTSNLPAVQGTTHPIVHEDAHRRGDRPPLNAGSTGNGPKKVTGNDSIKPPNASGNGSGNVSGNSGKSLNGSGTGGKPPNGSGNPSGNGPGNVSGHGGKPPNGSGNGPGNVSGNSGTKPPLNPAFTPEPKPTPRAPHTEVERHTSSGTVSHPTPTPPPSHEAKQPNPPHPHEAKPTPKPSPHK
jgi:hypothetical protein